MLAKSTDSGYTRPVGVPEHAQPSYEELRLLKYQEVPRSIRGQANPPADLFLVSSYPNSRRVVEMHS
jgi:hypothetical protein